MRKRLWKVVRALIDLACVVPGAASLWMIIEMGDGTPPKAPKALSWPGALLRFIRRSALKFPRWAKTTLALAPSYVRASKGALVKYSAFYLLLWSLEWFGEVPVELVLVGAAGLCPLVSFYLLKPPSALSWLRGGLAAKKKIPRSHRPAVVLLATIYGDARRFLSNPLSRVVGAASRGPSMLIWLLASLATLLELILRPLLVMWRGGWPESYPSHQQQMDHMVSEFLAHNDLGVTPSLLGGWVVSLAAYLALNTHMTPPRGQDPAVLIRVAFRRLLVTLLAVIAFEAVGVLAINYALVYQSSFELIYVAAAYSFLPALWWLIYFRTFEYTFYKSKKKSTALFCSLVGEGPHSYPMAPLRRFIDSTPSAVALAVLGFFYLAAKAASPAP